MSVVGQHITYEDKNLFNEASDYTNDTALNFWLTANQNERNAVADIINKSSALQTTIHQNDFLQDLIDGDAPEDNTRRINMFNAQSRAIMMDSDGEFVVTSLASAPRGCLPDAFEDISYDVGFATSRLVLTSDDVDTNLQNLTKFTDGYSSEASSNDMIQAARHAKATETLILAGIFHSLAQRNVIEIPLKGFVEGQEKALAKIEQHLV